MGTFALAAVSLVTLLAAGTALWLVSLRRNDVSIVDVAWGPAFAVVAALGLAFGEGARPRRLLVAALVAVWAARLAARIWRRNRGRGEDRRYRAFRERYGPERYRWLSLFQAFWLQAALAWVVSLPLQLAATAPAPEGLVPLDLLGALVWAVGFAFEAVGDAQLDRFAADPANRGRVMDRGLWRYTRHPNYFGDAVLWWGLGLIALAVPWGWVGLAGPALMTFLLLRVSGVAMLERDIAERRPGYRAYAARTSAFVPWPPRRG
ncbi:MAG TPA: DUF1295 domain-containing protein [Actinomycetota bacterium]